MIFNGKKKALKKGEIFLVKDLHKKFEMNGISKRHISEHFSEKYMKWDELDAVLKRLGKREVIQDIIGLPPHMRKEVDKVMAKQQKAEKNVVEDQKEDVHIKDYLKTIDSEVKKANKDLKIDKKVVKKEVVRPVRPVQEKPKPVVSNEDLDWLKSIPSEVSKARTRENEVQKESNVKADFESAGGVK